MESGIVIGGDEAEEVLGGEVAGEGFEGVFDAAVGGEGEGGAAGRAGEGGGDVFLHLVKEFAEDGAGVESDGIGGREFALRLGEGEEKGGEVNAVHGDVGGLGAFEYLVEGIHAAVVAGLAEQDDDAAARAGDVGEHAGGEIDGVEDASAGVGLVLVGGVETELVDGGVDLVVVVGEGEGEGDVDAAGGDDGEFGVGVLGEEFEDVVAVFEFVEGGGGFGGVLDDEDDGEGLSVGIGIDGDGDGLAVVEEVEVGGSEIEDGVSGRGGDADGNEDERRFGVEGRGRNLGRGRRRVLRESEDGEEGEGEQAGDGIRITESGINLLQQMNAEERK